jgi:hypothetical protein
MNTDLRFPVGKFRKLESLTPAERATRIADIAATPANLRAAVAQLNDKQLDTPYRPEGWTVRQVAHHVPDSHMNAYVRVKLALTENEPTIKPYEEADWAKLQDSKLPVEPSLALLENLHTRWVVLLNSLDDSQWTRKFLHPAMGPVTLDQTLEIYSWHGRHHVAHITALRARNGWS